MIIIELLNIYRDLHPNIKNNIKVHALLEILNVNAFILLNLYIAKEGLNDIEIAILGGGFALWRIWNTKLSLPTKDY